MLHFNDYLTEARISAQNFNKAVEIFKRLLERKLSTKLYRFGGDDGMTDIKNGVGILYLYSQKRAVRFNYVKGEIQSVTVWKKFNLGTKGDFTIDLGGLGLMQAGKKLMDIIANPSTQNVAMYPEILESEYLTEARRVSPAEFHGMIMKNIGPGVNINKMTWGQISDIALANDVQVPTVVRSTRIKGGPRGSGNLFDLGKLVDGTSREVKDPEKVSTDNEPLYYLKVTAMDPVTKRIMSVKGDQRAERILRTAGEAINNPDYNFKEEIKDPNTLFGRMKSLVQVVCRGARKSLVVVGGAGIGKSFVVMQTIKEEGLSKDRDWFMVKGKITNAALYQTLYMHRDGKLLVFDDADSCAKDTVIRTNVGNMEIQHLYEVIETMGYVGFKNEENTKFVLKPKDEIKVLSYNDKTCVAEYKPLEYIMKHETSKRMYEIIVGNKSVRVTEDHSCMVLRDGEIIEIKPGEINKQTDRIVYINA